MMEVNYNKKSYKKRILLVLLLLFFLYIIFIFILGFIKGGDTFLVFARNLYTTLDTDGIQEGIIDKDYLDNEFSCDDALYYGSTIEFYGCKVDNDKKEDYCIYDGDDIYCSSEEYTPSIGFTNNSGYFVNENILVDLSYDDKLYKEVLYCSTIDNVCIPNIKYDFTSIILDDNSISNKVCVQSINYDNELSEILCSDNYMIDKDKPVIKDPIIHGVVGNNGWYRSDVTIEVVDAIDYLSGILTTSISTNVINGNTDGERFSVTAVDNASNISVKDYSVKIDKNKPNNGSIIVDGILGDNGWYISPVVFKKTNGTDDESGFDMSVLSHNNFSSNTESLTVSLLTTDKAGNTNSTNTTVKIDVLPPVIDGVDDMVVKIHDEVDLMEGITVSDEISGLNGGVYIKSSNLNTDVAGVYEVIYEARDLAGNIVNVTRKVEVLDVEITYNILFEKLSEGNEFDWHKEDFYVKVKVEDLGHFDNVKYCYTTNDTCNPNINYNNGNILVNLESKSNKICVQVEQPSTLKSEIICSEDYKLDKTVPNIKNINDLNIDINSVVYPTGDFVEVIDNLSGVGSIVTTGDLVEDSGILRVDTSVAGIKSINYKIIDVAGNESVFDREFNVVADKPSINISTSNVSNSLGWYNTDVLVNIDAVDYSNTGIKDILYCTSTTFNCVPSISGDEVLLTTNHDNNRVCVQAIDNTSNKSDVFCSDPYKIDKIVPSIDLDDDIKFRLGTNVNLKNKSTILYGPSNGSVSCNILDTTILAAGTYNLECTINSNASLSSSDSTIIEVYSDIPTIEFDSNTSINGKGWANDDIDLVINAIDYSKTGINQVTYCITDASSCEPVNIGNRILLNTTGKTVCAKAIDNALQESEVYCSDEYKIDKMVPILSQIDDINMTISNSIIISDYFTVGFGISGKDVFNCNITETSDLSIGVHPLTCTAISNAGISRKIETVINVYATPYMELEYLESTGTQYIYTGLMNTGNYIFESDFMITDIDKNTGSWLLGGRSNFNYTLGIHLNPQGVYNAYGSSTTYYRPILNENTWYSLYFSINKLTVGDDTYPVKGQTLIPESFQYEMIIGGNNLAYNNITLDKRHLVGKIKYFKITDADSGVLLRHFIPVEIIASGELGYFDLVNEQFYSNDGSGEFLAP